MPKETDKPAREPNLTPTTPDKPEGSQGSYEAPKHITGKEAEERAEKARLAKEEANKKKG